MPNTREKLIELLDEAEEWADHKCDELECEKCPADKMKGNCVQQLMVDRLIANGVTLRKWIPVSERLPEDDEKVLILCKNGAMFVGVRRSYYGGTESRFKVCTALASTKLLNKGRVTHWMPLPDPPKGE